MRNKFPSAFLYYLWRLIAHFKASFLLFGKRRLFNRKVILKKVKFGENRSGLGGGETAYTVRRVNFYIVSKSGMPNLFHRSHISYLNIFHSFALQGTTTLCSSRTSDYLSLSRTEDPLAHRTICYFQILMHQIRAKDWSWCVFDREWL
jgi:hypothetical protein